MIDPTLYQSIADQCDAFVADADSANAEFDAMVVTLTQSTSVGSQFVANFQDQITNSRPAQTTSQFRQAVFTLQKLVVSESGSVDSYLSSNAIKVKSAFQALSNALGFPISDSNVV